MTQNNWGSATASDNTTTMVPDVEWDFFFKIIQDPTYNDLKRYLQGGRVAAYEKTALMKGHYKIALALNEGLARLSEQEGEEGGVPAEAKFVRGVNKRRSSQRAKRGMSSFVFATIEETGEMSVGDEDDGEFRYNGAGDRGRTPTLRSRESSRDNLEGMVEESKKSA